MGCVSVHLIGDPFDLLRRPVVSSTDVLTIRIDHGDASFLLHERDAKIVVSSAGTLGLIPAGALQQSSERSPSQKADFDLWRNVMREYSEKLLGNAEHSRDGVDYEGEPFRSLHDGLRSGSIRALCFGIGLDALTLWAEILIAVVFEAATYDEIFSQMLATNSEGTLAQLGGEQSSPMILFTDAALGELVKGGRLTPEAAACLELTKIHRDHVLWLP
jgi:hypothetical protein